MITVLKETPVTAYGRDCMELLVQNDEMLGYDACDLCAYRGWNEYNETQANCVDVHGCTDLANVYFQLTAL